MRVYVGLSPTKTSFSNGTSAVATLADTVTISVRCASKIYLYSPRKQETVLTSVGTVFCCKQAKGLCHCEGAKATVAI